MARAAAEAGRTDRAESLMDRVVSRRPRDPNVWKQRGLIRDGLGQPDRAAADFAVALDLLPRDRFFVSPRSQLILELAGHERAFAALLGARPDDKPLWIGRGRFHALRGRWTQAAADYARGIESAIIPDTQEYYEYACVLQLVGDEDRYRDLIRTLSVEVDETKDPRLAYELARACIIAPKPGVDAGRVIRWARLAAESSPLAWHCHVVGAAYYRAGALDEAIRWLADSGARQWDRVGPPLNNFVLAMTHRRLGHAARAAALLAESVRWCEEAEASRVDGAVPSVFAADWMTIQIYRREAESLIAGRATPTGP
jgi:tetratricopeptide (TPR) repeat protein